MIIPHEAYDGVFVLDSFYKEYSKLKNIIKKNSNKYRYHEGDFAYLYTWINDNEHMTDDINAHNRLITDYCSFIKSNIDFLFSTNVKDKWSFDAIIYPVGGRKGRHTDSFHKDENGELHEIHIYSSAHFLEEPESGGELYFPDLDLKIESKENRLVLFKCSHLHEVLEVTSGIKISVNYFWEIL